MDKIDTKKIMRTQSWFFEKMSKLDKPLANLTKMRRENTQINKISNKKQTKSGSYTATFSSNTKEIQGIIRDYFENLYSNKWENLEEMGRLLDTMTIQN
jgi:hypothetical protein